MSSNSKGFPLNNKADFIYYLRDIIDITFRYLIRLKRYCQELEKVIEINEMKGNPEKLLSSNLYEEFFDKIRHVQTVLLNLIGDKTKLALSYNKFREIADKRMQNGLDLNLDKLSDEMRKDLNRFNHWRNTNLHVPLSFLSSTRELARQKVIEDPNLYGHIPENPIYVFQYEFQYSSLFLIMLKSIKNSIHNQEKYINK